MNESKPREWLSVTQLIERHPKLLSRTLVYQEIGKGNLPHIRIGGKILIPADALDRLLEEQWSEK